MAMKASPISYSFLAPVYRANRKVERDATLLSSSFKKLMSVNSLGLTRPASGFFAFNGSKNSNWIPG
jgi:hypothetical protein